MKKQELILKVLISKFPSQIKILGKFLQSEKFKKEFLPILLLTLVLLFALFIRIGDMKWNIKDHPNFAYSTMEDEPYEISSAINVDPTDFKLSQSKDLMTRGAFFYSLCNVAYGVVSHSFLKNIFFFIYHHEISSLLGRYCFFRSIVIISSILLTFLIYKLSTIITRNKYIGVLSSFVFSTIFASTYYSVIYKNSIAIVLCITLLLVTATSYIRKPTLLKSVLMGICYSLSFAVKFDAFFSITIVAAAFLARVIKEKKVPLRHGIISCISSIISLFIFAPYIFLDFNGFREGLRIQGYYQITRSYHFEGFGFQPFAIITHLLAKGMGPILTIFSVLAVILVLYIFIKKRNYLLYFPLIIYLFTHFIVISISTWIVTRYTMLLFPILSLFISVLLVEIYKFILKRNSILCYLGISVMSIALSFHILWFLAFNNLIKETPTTIQATNWILQNVPSGSIILNDAMQSGPACVYGLDNYPVIEHSVYDRNNMVKSGKSFSDFDVDYIITSERSFRDFYRLGRENYGEFIDLYDPLFNSNKYTVIKKFETKASFFGITFEKGLLPQDLDLISPDTYLIKVNY